MYRAGWEADELGVGGRARDSPGFQNGIILSTALYASTRFQQYYRL